MRYGQRHGLKDGQDFAQWWGVSLGTWGLDPPPKCLLQDICRRQERN